MVEMYFFFFGKDGKYDYPDIVWISSSHIAFYFCGNVQ